MAEAAEDPKPAEDPSAGLYPVERNERYVLDRPITDETLATTYNNYYEFGSSKNIWQKAQALPIRPWTVAIDGMVETPMQIGIDDLLARMPLEERLYRHRCVEAWSMAVPYSGFPMKALVDLARPLSSARYVRMETFLDRDTASGQNAAWYPWPYIEGLTMAEATHELAFIATGLYGKPIPKQNGAPLRLAVPWKYGFKHIKGIVRFEFTDQASRVLLGGDPGRRVRLLGQCEPGGAPSALESGHRTGPGRRRAGADPALQRLTANSSPTSTRTWTRKRSGCSCSDRRIDPPPGSRRRWRASSP